MNVFWKRTARGLHSLVFDSVSRMSRNADEGYALYEELCSSGSPCASWKNLILIRRPIRKPSQQRYQRQELM